MYPATNVTPLSHEADPIHFPAQDRRLTLCSILLEKFRQETGTNWNLLRPLFDDLYPFHSHAQIEARADDAIRHDPYSTVGCHTGMEGVEYLVPTANDPEIFLGRCRFGFRAQSRGQYVLWPVRRHAGMHDAGI